MTDASIVAEPGYDQVLALSLERCLVPPLVVCLVGITGAAHVLRYRPPDLLAEHVGGELVPPINILVVDRIGWSRLIVLTRDDVALDHEARRSLCRRAGQDPASAPMANPPSPFGDVGYWCTAFRLALDEIAALVGLASKPRRPPVPERCALQAAVMVTTVREG